jgi:hypothetical protein
MNYQGPCPFQPEDIGYNDYADGLRDGAPSPMIDGETIEEIAQNLEDSIGQCGNEEEKNADLRRAMDEAIGVLEGDDAGNCFEEAAKILRNALS